MEMLSKIKWDRELPKEKKQELDYTMIRICKEFKLRRMQKGYTQKKLAELAGLKQPTIARFESGKTVPTLRTLVIISKALDRVLNIKLTK